MWIVRYLTENFFGVYVGDRGGINMRYHKGSLGLNQMKDKAILHFVADSRYVTRSQLSSFVLFEYCEPNRRVFNWRIQRLVEAGWLPQHDQFQIFFAGPMVSQQGMNLIW